MPVNPSKSSSRDLVKLLRNTLLCGMCDFAAFQFSPPSERSMMGSLSGRPGHCIDRLGWVVCRKFDAGAVATAFRKRCCQQPGAEKLPRLVFSRPVFSIAL